MLFYWQIRSFPLKLCFFREKCSYDYSGYYVLVNCISFTCVLGSGINVTGVSGIVVTSTSVPSPDSLGY